MRPSNVISQTRVDDQVAKWSERLGLSYLGLSVTHVYSEGVADDDGAETVASTEFNWQYRQGRIVWYLPNVPALTNEELGGCVVHELLHCLLNSMEQHVPDRYEALIEYAIETTTRAILHATKGE